mmetsp:Transcript_53165/g.127458  ORF Transcript_53165/g.127458 Transcript_53165/m.127458 type:complete len:205 (-) Transcript_53165:121-735(-)
MGHDELRRALPITRGRDHGDQDLARHHAARAEQRGQHRPRAPATPLHRDGRDAGRARAAHRAGQEDGVRRAVQREAAAQAGGLAAQDHRPAHAQRRHREEPALPHALGLYLPLREPDLPRLPRPRGHSVELPRRAGQSLRGPHPLVPSAGGGPHLGHLHHAEPGRHPLAVRGKLRGKYKDSIYRDREGLDTRVAYPEWEVSCQD